MKTLKKDLKRNLANLFLVVLGSIIMGIGYSLFIIPHHFVPGGVSGIAMIVNYFTRLPLGILQNPRRVEGKQALQPRLRPF